MFVRQMSYLVALAREQDFREAAEACRVTQATLSAGLRDLERELDIPLVIREPDSIGLTAEGERVATWAHQVIADYEGLKQDLSGHRRAGPRRCRAVDCRPVSVAMAT